MFLITKCVCIKTYLNTNIIIYMFMARVFIICWQNRNNSWSETITVSTIHLKNLHIILVKYNVTFTIPL